MSKPDYYLNYLERTDRFPQSVYHRAKHEIVAQMMMSVHPGSRVLDAACGIGHITAPYGARHGLTGVDEQPSAIEYCQKHWKGHYITGSLYKLPLENNSFDLILFLDAIEHFEQPEQAISELARVLKPGGRIMICTINYANFLWVILEQTWHRFFGGPCKPYRRDVHPTRYTTSLMRKHCAPHFIEEKIELRILNMEMFYFGKKPVLPS